MASVVVPLKEKIKTIRVWFLAIKILIEKVLDSVLFLILYYSFNHLVITNLNLVKPRTEQIIIMKKV